MVVKIPCEKKTTWRSIFLFLIIIFLCIPVCLCECITEIMTKELRINKTIEKNGPNIQMVLVNMNMIPFFFQSLFWTLITDIHICSFVHTDRIQRLLLWDSFLCFIKTIFCFACFRKPDFLFSHGFYSFANTHRSPNVIYWMCAISYVIKPHESRPMHPMPLEPVPIILFWKNPFFHFIMPKQAYIHAIHSHTSIHWYTHQPNTHM